MTDVNLLSAFVDFGVQNAQAFDAELSNVESRLRQFTDGTIEVDIAPQLDASQFAESTRATNRLDSAVEELESDLAQAARRAEEMQSALSQASGRGGNLGDQFNIDGIDSAASRLDAFGNANSRVNNLLFDTVNLAEDAQYGFRAISNNIPQVVRSFSLLSGDAGGVSAALRAVNVSIGSTVAAVPGLTSALAAVGAGAAVAGVAALVGRFDELSDSIGNVGRVAGASFSAVRQAISPIGDLVRDNIIDPIITLINQTSSDFAEFFNLNIGVEGFDSVQLARQEIDELTGDMQDASPAARALEADMERLRQGIADGTNDTLRARRDIRQLQEALDSMSTAQAVNEINEYRESLQGDDDLTEFERKLSSTIERVQELSKAVEEGADPGELFALGLNLQDLAETEAANALKEINDEFDSLTASERTAQLSAMRESLENLTGINDVEFVNIDFQVQQLTDRLEELTQRDNEINLEAERVREAEQATARLRRELEAVTSVTRTFEDDISDTVTTLASALQDPEIDLSLDDAIATLNASVGQVFQSQFDSLNAELQALAQSSGVNTFGGLQTGTTQELDAILDLVDNRSDADRVQQNIESLARDRNQLQTQSVQRLQEIENNLKSAKTLRVVVDNRTQF